MAIRYLGRVTGASALAILASGPALAQSNAELMDIIRQQQRQIEELSRKIDQLQSQMEQTSEKANAAAKTAQKVEEESPNIKVKWAPGPTFSSKDGSWSVHVLGRLLVDGGGLGDDDDFYKNGNATELRSARLGIEGNFYKAWKYKFETDFANARSTSRTRISSIAVSSWSPRTSASVSTRRRTRLRS